MNAPFVSSASPTTINPIPGLNDEQMGKLAAATLKDLDGCSTYEGKLLTLVRTLRHLEEATRSETLWRTERKGEWGPGWDECEAIYHNDRNWSGERADNDQPRNDQPAPAKEKRPSRDPRALLTPEWVEKVRRPVAAGIEALIGQSPGPLSMHLRRMAFVTGTAHMACQWGAFSYADRPLRWCGLSLALLKKHWEGREVDEKSVHRLTILGVMATIGSIAATQGYVTLATGIARRLTADLAAMARTAARLEGMPDADPVFVGRPDVVESITGMDQQTAEASLRDFSRALDAELTELAKAPPQPRPRGKPAPR